MELTHHSVSQFLCEPWGTFTVLSNIQISCLLAMTGAFSIIPHVLWNMLWELHAELSTTLKPVPVKSSFESFSLCGKKTCKTPQTQRHLIICDLTQNRIFKKYSIILGMAVRITLQQLIAIVSLQGLADFLFSQSYFGKKNTTLPTWDHVVLC